MAPIIDKQPKLLPAYRSLAWNIPADLSDDNPLLAVVELKPRNGIDILAPGTVYNDLLRKALEYCSSLSGIRIHCGQIGDENSVVILVELPSARTWQDFNASATLELLFATFESNPVSHCLRVPLSQSLEISGNMELLSVHLGTASEVVNYPSHERSQFNQRWAEFSKTVSASGICNVYGQWVETYCMASPFSDYPPGRRAAVLAAWDAQPMTFLIILSGISGDSTQRDHLQTIVSRFALDYEGLMSRRSVDIKPGLEQSHDTYTPYTTPAQSVYPLHLFDPVKPVFRRQNGMSLDGEDMLWRSLYIHRKARTGDLPPGPCGGYHPLGTINQYNYPRYPDEKSKTDVSLRMVDMLCLTFRPGALDASDDQPGELSARFRRFRKDVAALDHCEALNWARKHVEANVVLLFIGKQAKQASRILLQPFDVQ